MTLEQRFNLCEIAGANARARQREVLSRDFGQCHLFALRKRVAERSETLPVSNCGAPNDRANRNAVSPAFDSELSCELAHDPSCDFRGVLLKSEVAGIEEVDLRTWQIRFVGGRACGQEDGVTLAPEN